jgi:excinuclease ABC subunit C
VLPLDAELDFEPSDEERFFSSIPSSPGIFLIRPRIVSGGTTPKPYLAKTADLRRAAERLLRLPDLHSKRLNLRHVAMKFLYRRTASSLEQALALYHHAREAFPMRYRGFLRLRPPALLKIGLRNSYPRCYVTRRILQDGGYYFGPFASRKIAEAFATQFLDLFKIRRCQIKIHRDPKFPGCIYSEMKMCLAPCFAGCTPEEYASEVVRVQRTIESRGDFLIESVEQEREKTSEAQEFEKAAAAHRKLDKAAGVFRGLPEVIRPLDDLNAIVVQQALQPKSVALFVVSRGLISDPFTYCFDEMASQPRPAEEILRHKLSDYRSTNPPASDGAREQEDHLSVLARWFYSNPRSGEILFRNADWPYRKILRACARVLAPENTA